MVSGSKQFHLGDVLAITAEHPYISPTGVDGAIGILQYMMGQEFTAARQAGRAAFFCRPELLRQHPRLASIPASSVTPRNHKEWLRDQVARFGENLTVRPFAQIAPCGLCSGSGIDPKLMFEPCVRCNGLRQVPSEYNCD